jgi:hypothetical protein
MPVRLLANSGASWVEVLTPTSRQVPFHPGRCPEVWQKYPVFPMTYRHESGGVGHGGTVARGGRWRKYSTGVSGRSGGRTRSGGGGPAPACRRHVACFTAKHHVPFWNNRPCSTPLARRYVSGREIKRAMWREVSCPDGARSRLLSRSAYSSWCTPGKVDFTPHWWQGWGLSTSLAYLYNPRLMWPTVMQRRCHAPRAPRRMKRGLGSAVPHEEGTRRPSWAGSEVGESVVP